MTHISKEVSMFREYVADIAAGLDCDPFDIEEAVYWWCADHHSGQWSPEYAILSQSEFRPSPLSNGPAPDSAAKMLYDEMCAHAGCHCYERKA
jgi:hypothetical protein